MTATELLAALTVIFQGFVSSFLAVLPVFATLFVASLLDLASGVVAAWTSVPRTFDAKFLPAWIDSHEKKILRITLILVSAVLLGGVDTAIGKAALALGTADAGLYLAAVWGSIKGNVDDARGNIGHFPSFGGTASNLITVGASNDPIDER